MDFTEFPTFDSTFQAYQPTSELIVRIIDKLVETSILHEGLFLRKGLMLNVNIPVPYNEIKGIKFTKLAENGMTDFTWADVNGVIPGGGGPVQLSPAPLIGLDPVVNSDTNAIKGGYISITALDTDMTADPATRCIIKYRLLNLEP